MTLAALGGNDLRMCLVSRLEFLRAGMGGCRFESAFIPGAMSCSQQTNLKEMPSLSGSPGIPESKKSGI